jgi:uncharacterized protein YecE (DUF72 family)
MFLGRLRSPFCARLEWRETFSHGPFRVQQGLEEQLIRVGTSGYHYNHWRGPFYPEGMPASKMLAFYVERFDTVELNNTFYRLPPKKAVAAWYRDTPADFLFSAKGSRFITHMKKLKDPIQGLERYFEHVDGLGEKLGPVVFQLPPFLERNVERLEIFLAALPPGRRFAFEFRNPTWHCAEVYAMLERFNSAFCPFDIGGFQSPIVVTADFAYVRLHGPGPGPYQGSYTDLALAAWAEQIRQWSRTLKAVYLYFDNDTGGFAVRDANTLKAIIASQRSSPPIDSVRCLCGLPPEWPSLEAGFAGGVR